jgi:hypothetical protein
MPLMNRVFNDTDRRYYSLVWRLAKDRTCKVASCSTTEKIVRAGIDLSYSRPIAALPMNHANPNPVSNTPNAVLRVPTGMMPASTAFSSESWAPIPMPQRITPTKARAAFPQKTNGAKNAESRNAGRRTDEPSRSKCRHCQHIDGVSGKHDDPVSPRLVCNVPRNRPKTIPDQFAKSGYEADDRGAGPQRTQERPDDSPAPFLRHIGK